MYRPAAALVLTVLLLPFAAAQVPEVPPGTPVDQVRQPLALAPGPDIRDVRPLSGVGSTNLSVQFRCVALSPQAPTEVALTVAQKPAWLSVTVAPASVTFPANAPDPAAPGAPCTDKMFQEVLVLVSATAEAPAGVPGLIQITGTSGERTAHAFLNATAAAFVQIDAGASKTTGAASPETPWTFDVLVTNRGNAKAVVEFATYAARGIRVEAVGGEVGSLQAGDASNQQTFKVTVTPEATVVNGAYPAWVNVTAVAAGAQRPATKNLPVTITVEGAALPEGEDDGQSFLPVAFYAAPAALAVGAFLARRR